MSERPYPFDGGVEVPRRVAVCPYCDATMWADAWEWETLRSGRLAVVGIQTSCTAEPDIDSDEWWDWWDIHRQMPYVYQLPVDQRIAAWMRKPATARRYATTPDSAVPAGPREETTT